MSWPRCCQKQNSRMRVTWCQKMKMLPSTSSRQPNCRRKTKACQPSTPSLLIVRLLRTMTADASWTKEEALRIKKKPYQYFLKGGFLWRHPKRRTWMPRRVVVKREDQMMLMSKFHESPWASHRATWAMFEKLKEKYCWPSMYKDILHFVSTCES